MSRPVNKRRISIPPRMMGYRPYGMEKCRNGSVVLKLEEYESIRLVNYDMLSQEEAAMKMNVSRPTFTRIYNQAIKSVARAFAESKCIMIRGGNYFTDNDWYRCKRCHKLIDGIDNHRKCRNCCHYSMNELTDVSHPVPIITSSQCQ
ncbi:MAG: DUF134 domain-containing protein [Bacteroidales bacterium]|jgi:predicted DNA-binding protein (UPF0251 family)